MRERQLTTAPHGHLLTNTGAWSADGEWIVYDVRSAADGSTFDGTRIERVEVATGRVETLYESNHGACCGVVTASPVDDRVVFIHGPERPTPDWQYGPAHRQGVVVRASRPGVAEPLDARDLVAPFTSGALRGGSHVHVFNADASLVSFTYDDAVLDGPRCVGVSVCGRPVAVPKGHPRNLDGSAFSVLVTRVVDAPRPGSDEIARACEEGWVGSRGYQKPDGSWQRNAIAFQGQVVTAEGRTIIEAFIVDLPDESDGFAAAGHEPLAGTAAGRPAPPRGAVQRRLTFTAHRGHPGIQGPRHWLRSSPDGSRIACLMRDDAGVVQVFAVGPLGGAIEQMTHDPWSVRSAFTWSPDGERIAYVADGSVMTVDVATGRSTRRTAPGRDGLAPRPEACVFSPDGSRIAFLRTLPHPSGGSFNQVFIADA